MTLSPEEPRVAVIIDDEDDIRALLETVLSQAGFDTVSARSGIEGIRAVQDYAPLVTILDVSMPGMDGFETAKRIRTFSQTNIFMLTARSDEIDTLQGFQAGVDDYITKPFRPRELRARIDSVLRRQNDSSLSDGFNSASGDRTGDARVLVPQSRLNPALAERPGAVFTQGAVTATEQTSGPYIAEEDPYGTPQVASSAPAAAPVAQPVAAPVAQPVAAPVAQPVAAPVAQPVAAPVAQPVAAPVAAPVAQPVVETPLPVAEAAEVVEVQEEGWMEHNGLRMMPEMRLAELDGEELSLTRTEFDLLSSLMASQRRVRSKADLALLLRGESYVTAYFVNEADKRAVETHISNLRRKIGDSVDNPRWIETVRGVGYRLAAGELN